MITWMSVTDVANLPPDKVPVLTISLKASVIATTKTLAVDWMESGFGETELGGGRAFADNHGKVTHWAPLEELGTLKLTRDL